MNMADMTKEGMKGVSLEHSAVTKCKIGQR